MNALALLGLLFFSIILATTAGVYLHQKMDRCIQAHTHIDGQRYSTFEAGERCAAKEGAR